MLIFFKNSFSTCCMRLIRIHPFEIRSWYFWHILILHYYPLNLNCFYRLFWCLKPSILELESTFIHKRNSSGTLIYIVISFYLSGISNYILSSGNRDWYEYYWSVKINGMNSCLWGIYFMALSIVTCSNHEGVINISLEL